MALEVVKTGVQISLDQIKQSRQKVRQTTSDKGIEILLASIEKHGQIHAISLLQEPDGTYELINGHRRFTAAVGGKLNSLRANIYKAPSGQDRELLIQQHLYAANLAEPLLELERGRMFQALKDEMGFDDAQVAACFEGETADTVRRALRYLSIDEGALNIVQAYPEKFDAEKLNVLAEYASQEKRAWRLRPEEQVRIAETIASQTNKLTVLDSREVEKEARRLVKERRAESRTAANAGLEPLGVSGKDGLAPVRRDSLKQLFRHLEELETIVEKLCSADLAEITEIEAEDKRVAVSRLYAASSRVDEFISNQLSPIAVAAKAGS